MIYFGVACMFPWKHLNLIGVFVCFMENNKDLYPLIGWKIGDEVVYITEGCMSDTGNAIKWAQDISE